MKRSAIVLFVVILSTFVCTSLYAKPKLPIDVELSVKNKNKANRTIEMKVVAKQSFTDGTLFLIDHAKHEAVAEIIWQGNGGTGESLKFESPLPEYGDGQYLFECQFKFSLSNVPLEKSYQITRKLFVEIVSGQLEYSNISFADIKRKKLKKDLELGKDPKIKEEIEEMHRLNSLVENGDAANGGAKVKTPKEGVKKGVPGPKPDDAQDKIKTNNKAKSNEASESIKVRDTD